MSAEVAPMVASVVPTFNEEKWIGRCLDSLLAQTHPSSRHIIHVVDGGSTDDTLNIVRSKMKEDVRIVLINNPEKRVPQARNLSLAAMDEEVELVFEVNGHGWVPVNHLEKRISDLQEIESELAKKVGGVGCLVVAAEDEGRTMVGDWIESTLSCPLGSGGGQFARFKGRHPHNVPAFVLHRKEALLEVGGWDEGLPTNQDSDLSMRLIKAGWPLWRSDVSSFQMVKRRSLSGFMKMCRRYGFWRTKTLKKHKDRVNPKELLPIVGLLLTVILFAIQNDYRYYPLLIYAVAVSLVGLYEAMKFRMPTLLIGVPLLLLILHTLFSIGMVEGVFRKQQELVDR